jgi:hypothetical protein
MKPGSILKLSTGWTGCFTLFYHNPPGTGVYNPKKVWDNNLILFLETYPDVIWQHMAKVLMDGEVGYISTIGLVDVLP